MTPRDIVLKTKQHPIITTLLLVSAVVGSFLTLEKGAVRIWELVFPSDILNFSGEICTVSDKDCKEGNIAFRDFLSGKSFSNIELDLIVNTISVGGYAERCQSSDLSP